MEGFESPPRLVDHQRRVIIPIDVLKILDLNPGQDHVQFTVDPTHGVRIHKVKWTREDPSAHD